ncbi:flagella assembly protein FlgT middle domain-containing protein [Undibacterium cyanobacteriorum]|uniref:Flagella assembly protein FlgT middle domain-containing protein n=1 Tax=Undibacterium cyanobacteriorum TaxID=3073561 RepID=A0ABY9RMS5_9BURK|nr:flagella assembly protein FlgT middle domain-containing protein [Undibacterium sp. 20NA77.5]WMW81999.1 flagella assembly protein FlgT middle domain-containing protein [Undibacterium sp. 20NA77.5]
MKMVPISKERSALVRVVQVLGLYVLLAATALSLSSCGLFVKPVKTENLVAERVLKKKIVMTGFAVNMPLQVQDLDDVAQGVPRELLERLQRSGNFLVRQSKNLLSYDFQQETPSAQLVRQVAAENDAQFVIAGEIRNAGVRTDSKYWGLWETRKRQIEIDFAIYDGISGAFISRHHLYRPAEDDAKVGRDKAFGSVAFYATSFGKALDSVLQEAVGWIRQDLAPYPMMARILDIKGDRIVLDAGVQSNLVVGDPALVVAQYDQLPTLGLSSTQAKPLQYGIPQVSMGIAKIIQVQHPFAVAELRDTPATADFKVKVGDYVRFDPAVFMAMK